MDSISLDKKATSVPILGKTFSKRFSNNINVNNIVDDDSNKKSKFFITKCDEVLNNKSIKISTNKIDTPPKKLSPIKRTLFIVDIIKKKLGEKNKLEEKLSGSNKNIKIMNKNKFNKNNKDNKDRILHSGGIINNLKMPRINFNEKTFNKTSSLGFFNKNQGITKLNINLINKNKNLDSSYQEITLNTDEKKEEKVNPEKNPKEIIRKRNLSFYNIEKNKNKINQEIFKNTQSRMKETCRTISNHNNALKFELKTNHSHISNTSLMRKNLILNLNKKLEDVQIDYLKVTDKKPKNNVKGIKNEDFKDLIYIDEAKANIINHIESVLKMRNENFFKFKDICVDKYFDYAKETDIYEYVFGRNRYVPINNTEIIDKKTEKLKNIYYKMKVIKSNIYKKFEENKKKKK